MTWTVRRRAPGRWALVAAGVSYRVAEELVHELAPALAEQDDGGGGMRTAPDPCGDLPYFERWWTT